MAIDNKMMVHITGDDEVGRAIMEHVRTGHHAQIYDLIAEQGKVIHSLLTRLDRLEALPGVAEALEAARRG